MNADEKREKPPEKSDQPNDLWQFFQKSPLVEQNLQFERNQDISRDIEL